MLKTVEAFLEKTIFASRWILAPFYLGLIGGLVMLLYKFGEGFLHSLGHLQTVSEQEAVMDILALIDMSLAANLTLIVIFAGWENFVSKLNIDDHEDRPEWMGHVDFSKLKLKLLASIVAISAIQLLRAFMQVGEYSNEHLAWMVGIHMTFVVSGLILALMDRISDSSGHGKGGH